MTRLCEPSFRAYVCRDIEKGQWIDAQPYEIVDALEHTAWCKTAPCSVGLASWLHFRSMTVPSREQKTSVSTSDVIGSETVEVTWC